MKILNWFLLTHSRKFLTMNKFCWLLVLVVLLVLSSCNKDVRKSYWDNGKLKSELRYKGDKLNGESVWYTSDGKVMSRACYENDTLEGCYQWYYQNGVLEIECWYKHGLRDSICRSYSVKGNLASEDYYEKGKLNGESKKWYDNGQIFQEGQYIDGMMDGSWFIFYPSGALAGKAEYKMGTGRQICYEESGYKCLEVNYVGNLKHGKETYYNPDGRITKIVEYEKGKVVLEDNNPQNGVQ